MTIDWEDNDLSSAKEGQHNMQQGNNKKQAIFKQLLPFWSILLSFGTILILLPESLADYDKNSISSEQSSHVSATNPSTQDFKTAKTNEGAGTSAKHTTTKLYGRIEQIVQSPGAQFPYPLQSQTAKLDARGLVQSRQQGEASFSGAIVKSFPQQFTGTWGGSLKVWTAQIDPICWQIDADEANRMKQLLVSGREGTVNFNFSQDKGKIDLEPAQVALMVPMKETHMQEEMNKMLGGGQGQLGGGLTLPGMDANQLAQAMRQVVNNMNVPIILCFGAINRTDVEGISGNAISAEVLKNTIRQLSPGVLEQQIVAGESQRNSKTGKARQEYAETVIRFTSRSANDLYVVAAAVNYTADRKFERKLVLYGNVRRGVVMPDMTNPLNILNNTLPGGLQSPRIPSGQNPFQNLFPH